MMHRITIFDEEWLWNGHVIENNSTTQDELGWCPESYLW